MWTSSSDAIFNALAQPFLEATHRQHDRRGDNARRHYPPYRHPDLISGSDTPLYSDLISLKMSQNFLKLFRISLRLV